MQSIKQFLRTTWERLSASLSLTFVYLAHRTSEALGAALERVKAACGRSYVAFVVSVPTVFALWVAMTLVERIFEALAEVVTEVRAVEIRDLSRAHWEQHVRQ